MSKSKCLLSYAGFLIPTRCRLSMYGCLCFTDTGLCGILLGPRLPCERDVGLPVAATDGLVFACQSSVFCRSLNTHLRTCVTTQNISWQCWRFRSTKSSFAMNRTFNPEVPLSDPFLSISWCPFQKRCACALVVVCRTSSYQRMGKARSTRCRRVKLEYIGVLQRHTGAYFCADGMCGLERRWGGCGSGFGWVDACFVLAGDFPGWETCFRLNPSLRLQYSRRLGKLIADGVLAAGDVFIVDNCSIH